MEQFQLFDNTFTLAKITAYSLSLEIDYRHISYTIVDHIRRRFVALTYKEFDQDVNQQNYLDVVDAYIKSDQYLQKHYKRVDFIYTSNKFVLVPEKFFDKQNLKLYFEVGNELEEGEEIQFNFIPEISTYLLFAIPSHVTNFFVYRFPEINFYHQGIPLIKNYIKFSAAIDKPIVAINIKRRLWLDVLVMQDSKLLFYNIFKCQGDEHAFYDIMRVLKDFGYNSRVELLGDISTEDKLYQLLDKYLPDLGFAGLQEDYELEFEKPVEIHRFVNLFYISE